jgi:hypothetical protein
MLKKLRYLGIFLVLGLQMTACEVYRLPVNVVEATATPEPKLRTTLVVLETQPGNTDLIVIFGILIFAFIAIPILLHYKEWRLPQKNRN